MVSEAVLKETEAGLAADGEGWFVVNARAARWWRRQGLGRWCDLEGGAEFEQLGIRLARIEPGEPSGMYHGEAGQEDFLVLSGECVLVIEGEEQRLKAWDFVHCPPWTEHIFVGAGDEPCIIVTAGARTAGQQIRYPVNEVAAKHGASVATETPEPREAYAHHPRDPLFIPYREGDLPAI
jgi:uncharacterized cupin superfamily protein